MKTQFLFFFQLLAMILLIPVLPPSQLLAQVATPSDPFQLSLLSLRCKELSKDKDDKLKNRQRLTSLYDRNQKLMTKLKQTRPLLQKRLKANALTLRNELYLATLETQAMEENMIRTGCPNFGARSL
jgi:hypothetical protein